MDPPRRSSISIVVASYTYMYKIHICYLHYNCDHKFSEPHSFVNVYNPLVTLSLDECSHGALEKGALIGVRRGRWRGQ